MGIGDRNDRAADDARFAAFFDAETPGQVRRATLLLGSVDEANDVVQEAMIRLYQRWKTVSEPGPYLNRVVLNLCRDRGRRSKAQQKAEDQTADRAASMDDPLEILDDVLAALPFNQRAAVVLRYWGGMPYDAIAAELNCSPGSVGPWINRALADIREVLS